MFLYGRDTDLIVYTLLMKIEDLTMLSRSEETRIKIINSFFMQKLDNGNFHRLNKDRMLKDLIFSFIFLGTDYVPALPSFECNINKVDALIESYLNYVKNICDDFYKENKRDPVDNEVNLFIVEDNGLNLENLKNYFILLDKKFNKLEVNNPIENKRFYSELLDFEEIRECDGDHINFLKEKRNLNKRKLISTNYLKTCYWNLQLYNSNLLSWSHCFKYAFPIPLRDIIIEEKIDFSFFKSKPLTPFQCLTQILPKSSIYLASNKLNSKISVKKYMHSDRGYYATKNLYTRNYVKITQINSSQIRKVHEEILKHLDKDDLERERSLNLSRFEIVEKNYVPEVVKVELADDL